MGDILEFCVRHHLITEKDADILNLMHERYWTHPIRIIIENTVPEHILYAAAVKEFQLPLFPENELWFRDKNCKLNDSSQQSLRILALVNASGEKRYVTFDFLRWPVTQKALENIFSPPVDLRLASCSLFDRLSSAPFGP